jgi:hypothetical protein
MILFWVLCAGLIIIALAFILPAVITSAKKTDAFRHRGKSNHLSRSLELNRDNGLSVRTSSKLGRHKATIAGGHFGRSRVAAAKSE